MSDSYFGIGKLNFILFLVIYVLAIGITNAVFNPTTYSVGSGTGLGFEAGVFKDQQQPPSGSDIFSALNQFVSIIFTGMSILFNGFWINVPGVPLIVNLLLCLPVDILLVIVLMDIIRDILGGWHDFVSSLKPFG